VISWMMVFRLPLWRSYQVMRATGHVEALFELTAHTKLSQ
jgi:hypothetical protein